jgi:hypothetical protein
MLERLLVMRKRALECAFPVSVLRALTVSAFFAAALGLASGYQVLGLSRDYENYFLFFDFVRSSSVTGIFAHRHEPGFSLLVFMLSRLSLSNVAIYSSIAALCIFIKYQALGTSKNYWLVVVIFTFYYAARYLTLFEMTVIRATVAASIAFFVFYRKTDYGYDWRDVLWLILATLMHYSAFVFIFIYFLQLRSRASVIAIGSLVFVAIAVSKNLALAYLSETTAVFSTYSSFNKATFLPIPFAVDIAFLGFVLANWKINDQVMKTCAIGMTMAVVFHFSLLEYSLIAARFREILSFFSILYVVRAVGYSTDNMKVAALAYAVASSVLHLYIFYIYDPLLT